jgi:hypothetical protein
MPRKSALLGFVAGKAASGLQVACNEAPTERCARFSKICNSGNLVIKLVGGRCGSCAIDREPQN